MAKLLIVDDDLELCTVLRDWLEREAHIIDLAHTTSDAKEFLRSYQYDLIVLDWSLPDGSGLNVMKEFRAQSGHTPILMLTGKNMVEEKEMGLDSGADDYLTKPFAVKELSARIRALLRRPAPVAPDLLEVGDLKVDSSTHEVICRGTPITLFRREFTLLEYLMRNKDQVFSAEILIERLWSSEMAVGPETIRTCVRRIREKIDQPGQPSILENIRGVGYRIRSKP